MQASEKLDPSELPNEAQARHELGERLKARARETFQRGELISAMLFASDALMLFPNERSYLDLADEIALASPDPLSTVPVATGAVHVATAAVRARILMMQRNLHDAIDLLCRVIDVAPDLGYLPWITRWSKPDVITRLGWDLYAHHVVRTVLRAGIQVPPNPDADDPRLINVKAGADLFAALRAAFPNEAVLYFGEALLRRRLNDPNATLSVALEGVKRFPQDWKVQTATANAFRQAGRPADSETHARQALAIDPKDNSPLYDLGWAYMEAKQYDRATHIFHELLSREPDYEDAKPSFHYARFRGYNTPEDKSALLLLREREWWSQLTRDLCEELEPMQVYYTFLQGPGDAAANAGRSFARELMPILRCCGQGIECSIVLESKFLESPSANLAFDLVMRSLGARGSLDVKVEEIQQPDPRADKAQAQYRLWSYQDTKPSRVYPAADPSAQQAIASIAQQLYRQDVWDNAARAVAQQWGAQWLHGFLAVMTDPPMPPQDGSFDGFYWTYRCQVAAALVLSHLGPWESGPGRGALYSLVFGPSDWTTAAGIIALGFRAKENPALRPEIEQLFGWLRSQAPARGYTEWEHVLAHVWLGLGQHPEATKAGIEAWITQLDEDPVKHNRVKPPTRRYGGLTLEQYAEFKQEVDRIMGKIGHQGVLATGAAVLGNNPPPELVQLLQRFNLPLRNANGNLNLYIPEWQEALNNSRELQERFIELQELQTFAKMGVNAQEKAALDEIKAGNMDMHLRMAQAQQAQHAMNTGNAGDPDPVVFPGQKVAKLSDYVGILKGMQKGDMMGALARYGLDMMSYGQVATAWGAKMAADPVLTEKFSRMMNG
ncbi:MAG TPA: tetratricopeptide repeat protein [Polyangiaceae bacterium]|nr:tetratricopeptide repeat protein [Polyangiaceae bacterium]